MEKGQYWTAWVAEENGEKRFLIVVYHDGTKTGLSLILGERDRGQLEKMREILDIFLNSKEKPVINGYA